jgi:hypothetical protein
MKRHVPSNPHSSIPSFSTSSHRLPRRKSYRRPRNSSNSTNPTTPLNAIPTSTQITTSSHTLLLSLTTSVLPFSCDSGLSSLVFSSRRSRYTHNVVLPAFNLLLSFLPRPLFLALHAFTFPLRECLFLLERGGFLSIIHGSVVLSIVFSFPFAWFSIYLSLTQAKELRACLIDGLR